MSTRPILFTLPIRVRPAGIRPFTSTATLPVKYGWATHPPRSNPHEWRPESTGLPPLTTSPSAALLRKEHSTPLRSGVLAIKKGMSAVYQGKKRIPCTLLQMDQVQVVATKNVEKHGYWAVQMGLGSKKARNVTGALLGYYEAKGIAPKRYLGEFRVRSEEGLLPVGAKLGPTWFAPGQHVDVRATSKGKGFAGGMKRHGFGGQPASHGNSKTHRAVGSLGPSQGGGSRVHPGKKMPGRMGGESTTVQNLEVLQVDEEMGLIVVKGAVGGPKGGLVKIADAIKKKQPSEVVRERSLSKLLKENEGVESVVEQARKVHLEMKEARATLTMQRKMAV